MHLRTTTWFGRNERYIQEAYSVVVQSGLRNPRIIDVGPGGLISPMSGYLPEGASSSWGAGEKMKRAFVKPLEAMLRKTGLFPLATFEPGELLHTFGDLEPSIVIVDSERAVLDAAEKILGPFSNRFPIDYVKLDITKEPIPLGDVIICHNVLGRTSAPEKAATYLADAVNIGGILSCDIPPKGKNFVAKGARTYQNIVYQNLSSVTVPKAA